MPTEKPRLTITVTDEERKQIEDYWHEHKMKNQTQAILSLVKIGLDEIERSEGRPVELQLSPKENQLLEKFRHLNSIGKQKLAVYADDLTLIAKYRADSDPPLTMVARGGETGKPDKPIGAGDISRALEGIDPTDKL